MRLSVPSDWHRPSAFTVGKLRGVLEKSALKESHYRYKVHDDVVMVSLITTAPCEDDCSGGTGRALFRGTSQSLPTANTEGLCKSEGT